MFTWIKKKIQKFWKWLFVGGTAVAIAATMLPADQQFAIGDKVKYVGDLSSAYNKVGWIVDIEPQYDTPYMIAFTEFVDHKEETTKWQTKYNPYSSHPFPYNLPAELRWDYENRAWASASQLEKISAIYVKRIDNEVAMLIEIKLETFSQEEIKKAEDVIMPPVYMRSPKLRMR